MSNGLRWHAWSVLPSTFKLCLRYASKKTGCYMFKSRCKKPFVTYPCGKPDGQLKQPTIFRRKKPQSMWPNPFCDEGDKQCPFNPRFDDIYYVESDKAQRRYWQTWVSCPPLKIRPKKVCCYEKTQQPPVRRRKHKKPKTACPIPVDCLGSRYYGCQRSKRRCHKAGRIPPKCNYYPPPADCDKPLTPYPAFSECTRMRRGQMPLSECLCLKTPMLCEVWNEWRRRLMYKKSHYANESNEARAVSCK